MRDKVNLGVYDLNVPNVYCNPDPAFLYEEAIRLDPGSVLTHSGALVAYSGEKTGRSPKDKRIVEHPKSAGDIWWGNVNIKIDEHTFLVNRERAIDYLNTRRQLYVIDGFAGWEPDCRIKVRVICSRPYHALFMHNMLIRPTAEELRSFGDPDYVLFNAGHFPANRLTSYMTSKTSIDFCFERQQIVILGTEYAGEMKKGIFTVMNYLLPKRGILSMHCSANEGARGDVTLFFGLSGTGKTTLSADPRRQLIGDDEHGWSDQGIFNIEGGCYAKCINLSEASEPEIFHAIRYGTLLENVVVDPISRRIKFDDASVTENTRASYPIEYIENVKVPCRAGHPKNIIFLTADAFGVLPPMSRLTPEQAMYHFISGYTAKVAGTEMGVKEPEATFSACFGAAFMVWHPNKYAEILAERMRRYGCRAWLLNTGWTGGPYGVGERMKLSHTRAMIDAIHSGEADSLVFERDPVFGVEVPKAVPEVPSEVLIPKQTWKDPDAYDQAAVRLAGLFKENFKKFESGVTDHKVVDAGPV